MFKKGIKLFHFVLLKAYIIYWTFLQYLLGGMKGGISFSQLQFDVMVDHDKAWWDEWEKRGTLQKREEKLKKRKMMIFSWWKTG